MTDYPLDMQLVVDPLNPENVVANGSVYFYDPSDLAGVSPIAIKDPSGLPLPNPLPSNEYGFIQPTIVTIPRVKWKSGTFEGFFYSYDGLRNEAVAAKTAAQAAAAQAAVAATAPTDAAVDVSVDKKLAPAISTALANDPTVIASAANMAQTTAGLVPAWKASTVYSAGQKVIAPNGDVVSAKVSFTSTAAYSATNWNPSTQDGRIGATEVAVIDAKWFQAGLTASSPIGGALGSIKDGAYRVTSDATATTLALPYNRAGEFSQLTFGTFGFQSHKTVAGSGVRLWSGTAWGAWTYPDRAYTDTAVAGVKWYQGGLLSTDPVNGALGAIKDGIYRATSDTRAVELSLPDGRAGKLTQISSGTFGMHVYESLLGQSVRLWSSTTSSWGTWTNPDRAYTDTAMETVKWYQGGLTAAAPISDALGAIKDGDYRVTQDSTAAALGLPDGRAGNFKQVSYGTFGFQSHTTLLGTSVRLWSSTASAWGAWASPNTAPATPAPTVSSAASGMKLVPLALTLGHGGTAYGQTDATVRYPMWWGAPISRFRVHIRNANPRENTLRTGAVSFPQGLYLGTAGAFDGLMTSAVQIAPAFSTPDNADEWVSGWIEKELSADTKHILSGAYVASGTVMNNAGACWTSPGHIADSTAGTWTQGSMAPFDVWIEAETPAMTPTVAALGDSLSVGTASTMPVLDSAISQYMRAQGGLPIHYAHVGDSFNSYNGGGAAGSEVYKKTRWTALARPDSVLIAMGSNDIFGGSASLVTMKARMASTLAWVQSALASTVFLSTITTRTGVSGAQEDVRRAYNIWLKQQTQPGGVARGVFDFAAAISADDETIIPEYDGDTIHLTTAGYAAEAATLRNLTSPAPAYRV